MSDPNFRVIALDPGGTTGWATYSAQTSSYISTAGKQYLYADEEWACGQIGPEEHHLDLYEFLELQHIHDTVVVCESFEYRNYRHRDNLNLMSKEYIGVTKLFGQERDVPVVFQTAGAAKPFVTDQKLKKMGLWYPGQKHAMDAMRHLVFHLVNKNRRTDLIKCWKDL